MNGFLSDPSSVLTLEQDINAEKEKPHYSSPLAVQKTPLLTRFETVAYNMFIILFGLRVCIHILGQVLFGREVSRISVLETTHLKTR